MTLEDRLDRGGVVLLDGAMGTELERRGVAMHGQAWSALAMLSHPEVVRQVHADYIAAGAQIHIVNSFATARHVLERTGHGAEVARLNRQAVALCREAIAARGAAAGTERPLWIAGSMSSFWGPADRSGLPVGPTLRANYDEQAALLVEAGIDLLALEMLADIEVSAQLIASAGATGLPLMVGFTCVWAEDGTTVGTRGPDIGMTGSGALDRILPEVLALLPDDVLVVPAIMHSDLDVTDAALEVLARHWPGPLAAYPNSGAFVPPNWQFDTVCVPSEFAAAAIRWAARDVRIIGGCCGLGPDHIHAAGESLSQSAA